MKYSALECGWGLPMPGFFIDIEGICPPPRCGARIIVVLAVLSFVFHPGFGLMRSIGAAFLVCRAVAAGSDV
jgi:hypothetical protein